MKTDVKLKKENVNFKDNTNEEKELNETLFHITLELNRYQDMTQEVLNYITQHEDIEEVKEIYNIIKKWAC